MLVVSQSIQTCTLDHNKGTSTFALLSTSTLDQSLVTEKPSNGVSVCVVKFPLLTFRVSNDLSYIVPAAPAFWGHPKLCPPDECEKSFTIRIQRKGEGLHYWKAMKQTGVDILLSRTLLLIFSSCSIRRNQWLMKKGVCTQERCFMQNSAKQGCMSLTSWLSQQNALIELSLHEVQPTCHTINAFGSY